MNSSFECGIAIARVRAYDCSLIRLHYSIFWVTCGMSFVVGSISLAFLGHLVRQRVLYFWCWLVCEVLGVM